MAATARAPSGLSLRLVLPSEDPEEWARVAGALAGVDSAKALDAAVTAFARADADREQHHDRPCSFFAEHHASPAQCGDFDMGAFMEHGLPFLVRVALDMPRIFEGVVLPIARTGSAAAAAAAVPRAAVVGTALLEPSGVTLSREQRSRRGAAAPS